MGGRGAAALGAAAALLLSSCIGIESRVTFNRDGSGVLRLEYRVAKSLAELGRGDSSILPVPANEEDLRRAFGEAEGLKLIRITRTEDGQDVRIAAEVAFDKVESLSAVEALADRPMRLERSGDDFVFRQVIASGAAEQTPETPATAESEKELADLFAGLFEGYEVVFVVSAPRPIKSHSAGDASADRRSVTWRLPLGRLAELRGETTFAVSW